MESQNGVQGTMRIRKNVEELKSNDPICTRVVIQIRGKFSSSFSTQGYNNVTSQMASVFSIEADNQ